MPRPIKDKELTLEEVREWLRLAQTDRLNIFHDRNAIIVWLCKSLLKEWEAAEKEKSND
tara:strand:+ start:20 stop:196 length:177 start_codon:yes stop_codon:yes gene_type:complete